MNAFYLIVLVVLFLAGMPVALAIGNTSLVMSFLERGVRGLDAAFIAQKALYGVDNFLLLAVPFFLYAGKVMNTGGITNRIFRFATSLVGYFRGGLGHVNVVASVIFAGMTGTAVSDAAGLGAVEIKAMNDAGYDPEFSVAITAASSTIGPIIPPSVPLVIFGLMTGASIGKLLIGGLIPGLLMAVALMIAIEIYASRREMPKGAKFDLGETWRGFKLAFFPLLTPVIIVGGILAGVFTPTEAAAVAAAYATVLSVCVYREITLPGLWAIIKETVVDTGGIMFIVAMAMAYGYMITRSNVTNYLVDVISGISTNPTVVLFIIILLLLFIGCFLEATAAITIMSPILLPILAAVGIDTVHFGIIMVLTMMIGLLTPPFGMVLFVLNKISGIPLDRIVRAVTPFIIPLLAVDALLVLFPKFVTWLPDLLFK
ncbi:MAG: TRAP transporter large permease [Planctomycetota bacterium]|jgi:tripartite ATP-independent transporter DctM subunit|nr:TRAP transporter large permease [Planctomycetota bacterium]